MIGSESRVRHTIIELFVKVYLPLYRMKLRTQRYLTKKRMRRETTREGRWIQDLEYMASQLRRRHKNLFHTITEKEFDQAVSQLRESIPHMNDHEVVCGLASIVALVGDAHTQITLQQKATGFGRYPVKVRWFSDGLFVVETSREYRDLLRSRLIRIGTHGIDDAYTKVSSLISQENEPFLMYKTPRYLVVPEILQALGLLVKTEKAPFLFELEDGSSKWVEMSPVKRGTKIDWESALDLEGDSLPLYLQNPESHYSYERPLFGVVRAGL